MDGNESTLNYFLPIDLEDSSTVIASKCFVTLMRPCLKVVYIGNLKRLVEDRLEEFHSVLTAEWRKPCHHLLYYATQTPPINTLIMTLLLYHLRSQVLRCTTHRHSFLVFEVESATQSKISQFDIPIFV